MPLNVTMRHGQEEPALIFLPTGEIIELRLRSKTGGKEATISIFAPKSVRIATPKLVKDMKLSFDSRPRIDVNARVQYAIENHHTKSKIFQCAKREFTCFDCPMEKDCRVAWDAYNLNGDCLAEK